MSFIYQLLIIVAVLVALPFQRNWKDRWFLLVAAIGSAVVIDVLLIGLTYLIVKNNLPGSGLLDGFLLFLPLMVPAIVWYYTEVKIKSNYDYR